MGTVQVRSIAELELGNLVVALRRGFGQGQRTGRAENDQLAVGDDQAAAIEAAGLPLALAGVEVKTGQLVVVEAVEIAIQEHRGGEVVLHLLVGPDFFGGRLAALGR